MEFTLPNLVECLSNPSLSSTRVIPWGSPVPTFGDLSRSRVATLGLNPSNREFVDNRGNELSGAARRFHTLGSLGLARWADAQETHYELIVQSCRAYFTNNPYDSWFRQLDHVIAGTAASYYDQTAQACHLDLIPFATVCKWTELSREQRATLFSVAGDTLGHLLKDSPVRILVLNGRSVVEQFAEIAGVTLEEKEMEGWALRRGGHASIAGYSYKGQVSTVAGVELGREVLILGYNHNLQSSFGVTNVVRTSIRRWIARAAREAVA